MSHTPKKTDKRDRHVPSEYSGYLDPNYYCRAWNAKRDKYCRSVAGSKTDHPGTGRCNVHGGNYPVQHGQTRRYQLSTLRVQDLLQHHLDAPDPLDLLPDLAVARAMLQDFIERTVDGEHAAGGLAQAITLVSKIAGIVEGIERAKSQHALSVKELDLLMLNLTRVVRQHVSDDAVFQRIQDGWLAIKV